MTSRFIAIPILVLFAQSAMALDLGVQVGLIHTAYSNYYNDEDGPLLLLTAGSPLSPKSIVRLGVTAGIWSQHYKDVRSDMHGDVYAIDKTTLPGYILGVNLLIDNRSPKGTPKPIVRTYTGIGTYWTAEKQNDFRDDYFWKDMWIVEALTGLAIPTTSASDLLIQLTAAEEISKTEKRVGSDNVVSFTLGYRFKISDLF